MLSQNCSGQSEEVVSYLTLWTSNATFELYVFVLPNGSWQHLDFLAPSAKLCGIAGLLP